MNDRFQPLNPLLYQRLRALYGHVDVMHEGDAAMAYPEMDVYGKVRLRFKQGEYYLVRCFAPETLVATPAGDKPISTLVGTSLLLIPNAKGLGSWQRATVRSFGVQPLLRLHLKRKGATKTIRVTPEHRWLVSGRIGLYKQVITKDLRPGDKLASCFGRSLASYGTRQPWISGPGVAQGFVFGDGSCERRNLTPASVRFQTVSKDAALLPYFAGCRIVQMRSDGKLMHAVCDLPRFWKQLPPADESLSFLMGWLAGYFAADGHVDRSGKTATLYSCKSENLNFVKGVCYRLGIRVSPIRAKRRSSAGCVKGSKDRPMYGLSFAVQDVPESFWLIAHHRRYVAARAAKQPSKVTTHWTVTRVEDCGESDEVFCAVVPGVEKFTLADNLLTMNCPFCQDHKPRLYISYLWGHYDPAHRTSHRQLAICYNEDCMSVAGNRDRLYFEVYGLLDAQTVRAAQVFPGRPTRSGPIGPPGRVVSLLDLPPEHPANAYLMSRGFEPRVLAAQYRLGYCEEPAPEYQPMWNRLVIPIYQDGQYIGFQGRVLGAGEPRYYNPGGSHKTNWVYNLDLAKTYSVLVITEGVMKVWRVGPFAVSVFGKSISGEQPRLLSEAAAGAAFVVLYLDADAWTHKVGKRVVSAQTPTPAETAQQVLRQHVPESKLVVIRLEGDAAPDNLSTEVNRQIIEGALRARGWSGSLDARRVVATSYKLPRRRVVG